MSVHTHKQREVASRDMPGEDEVRPACSSERLADYLTGSAVKSLLSDARLDSVCADGLPPLLVAARNGLSICARALLADHRVDPNQSFGDGSTALMLAAERGHVDVVVVLLEDFRVNPNATRPDGATALILAAENGHTEVVETLLRHPEICTNQFGGDGIAGLQIAKAMMQS